MSHPSPLHIHLSATRVLRYLLAVLGMLFVMQLASLEAIYHGNPDYSFLVAWFNFDEERNLPTLFSTLLFLAAAAQLSWIGHHERCARQAWLAWKILAVLFIFLGIDELASFHEGLIKPVSELTLPLRSANPHYYYGLHLHDWFHYGWLLVYLACIGIAALLLIPWLLRLPFDTRWRVCFAALLFLSGAAGFEMLGGAYAARPNHSLFRYHLLYTTNEELLEFLGLIVFNYALTRHIELHTRGLRITLGAADSRIQDSSTK